MLCHLSEERIMTIPVKKERHETFLDFEMRKYYQARIKGYIVPSETKAYITNWRKNQIKVSKSVV